MTTKTLALDSWLNDIVNDIGITPKIPPARFVLSDDPLALSWASYHVWVSSNQTRRWTDLREVVVSDRDRQLAHDTRQYYRNRLMMRRLRGQELTQFQNRLHNMVSTDAVAAEIEGDLIGLLMKIPYFYHEDTALDQVFAQTRPLPADIYRNINSGAQRTETIRPLAHVFASRRHAETNQYWWQDSQGHAVVWVATTNNPLGSLLRGLYNRAQPLTVQANWFLKQPRGPMQSHIHWNLACVELV